MDNQEIQNRLKELYKGIDDARAEIKTIQENCNHPTTVKELYSWRVGSTVPAVFCEVCDKVLGTELNKIL